MNQEKSKAEVIDGILREFADMHNLTYISFDEHYKALLNGSVMVYFYLKKGLYRIEGSKKYHKLPSKYQDAHKRLQEVMKSYGKGVKTTNMVRIVR